MWAVENRPSWRNCSRNGGSVASAYPDSVAEPKRSRLYQRKNKTAGRNPTSSQTQSAHGKATTRDRTDRVPSTSADDDGTTQSAIAGPANASGARVRNA